MTEIQDTLAKYELKAQVQLRLEALKLANQMNPGRTTDAVIDRAESFYKFLTKDQTKETNRAS